MIDLADTQADAVVTPAPNSFKRALQTIGLPGIDKPPEEELVHFLRNAAEIEHGIMLQYLYAYYSAKNASISGALRMIAIEEMGHFISVQNLLVACGAEPHFGHGNWGDQGIFQPYAFRLEPVSTGSLAKYSIGEMPDESQVPPAIKPDLQTIEQEADATAGSSVAAHRVGLLYAKIYWLLRADDRPLQDPAQEPWQGFPVAELAACPDLAGRHVRDGFVTDATRINAQPADWRRDVASAIVQVISGRNSALQGIAAISAQGEGFATTADAHFERFVNAWREAKKTSDIAYPMPVNPFDGTGTSAAVGEPITSNDGLLCARMADQLYELVLLCIAANLLLPPATDPKIRAKAAKAALIVMRDGIGEVATTLRSIPLTDSDPTGKVCGLPFSVVPTDVPANISAVLDRAHAVIASITQVGQQIAQGPSTPPVKDVASGVIDTLDSEITPLLDSLVA